MSSADRSPARRVPRRRASLLQELTDEIEPDSPPSATRRLAALLILIASVAAVAGGIAFVIMAALAKTH